MNTFRRYEYNVLRIFIFIFCIICYINGNHLHKFQSSSFKLSETKIISYLQPNDIINGKYDKLTTAKAENQNICTRPCDKSKPMICYYTFDVEEYTTLGPACGMCTQKNRTNDCNNPQCVTADGKERKILTINRQYPGPSIQVCPGDLIIVDIINKFLDRTISIHWHGLYQKDSPFMDGVPSVTQCPILPGTTFRYKFIATPYGTFFFHSHSGLQKMDGIVSSLIIRRPRSEDPLSNLYDFDLPSHVILFTDWLHTMTDDRFPGNRFNNTGFLPASFLANGRTQYFNEKGIGTGSPYSIFYVTSGKKYRFRLIGATCGNCPVLIIFEKHKLLFISSDGTPAVPTYIDSLTLLPGERFDVVLTANQTVNSYWIQMKGLGLCVNKTNFAVLQYNKSKGKVLSTKPPSVNAFQRGITLNPVDITNCINSSDLCFSKMSALISPPIKQILKAKPDVRIILGVDFYSYQVSQLFKKNTYHRWLQPFPNTVSSSLINNHSYISSPFSLLTQNNVLPKELICPTKPNACGKTLPLNICECTHIIKVPLNSIAELIFIDYTAGNTLFAHPLHLHGTDMFIIKQGKIPANIDKKIFVNQLIKQLDNEGINLFKTKPKPIVKDTIGNLPSGYTVVRTHFNNPGMWYFHCHFIFHTDTGMTLVFQVGDRKHFVKPPANFPRCNNFKPTITAKDTYLMKKYHKTV